MSSGMPTLKSELWQSLQEKLPKDDEGMPTLKSELWQSLSTNVVIGTNGYAHLEI